MPAARARGTASLVAAEVLEVAVDRGGARKVGGWGPGEDGVELVESAGEDGETWCHRHRRDACATGRDPPQGFQRTWVLDRVPLPCNPLPGQFARGAAAEVVEDAARDHYAVREFDHEVAELEGRVAQPRQLFAHLVGCGWAACGQVRAGRASSRWRCVSSSERVSVSGPPSSPVRWARSGTRWAMRSCA